MITSLFILAWIVFVIVVNFVIVPYETNKTVNDFIDKAEKPEYLFTFKSEKIRINKHRGRLPVLLPTA